MKIKNDLRAAFQLLGLLCLLFWSFTWNIPKDFDLLIPKIPLKSVPETCMTDASVNKGISKRVLVPESSKSSKPFVSNTNSLLPPFNVWKEVELRKQAVKDVGGKLPVPKIPRRKLNYASAKCGAKILASNKESKHRMSILNEKVDEYMLNPCGIKQWFILELCDTIEASQIELANYELYSSMPKDFSIFWSNMYPTQTWYTLGTFQAKNERTMQTFSINSQNLGKFIKVVISSHHGWEHFCPLSVFRVVGYSMVYEYDVIEEQKEQEKSKNNSERNGTETESMSEESLNSSKVYSSIKQITFETKPDSNSKGGVFPVKLCQKMQKYCAPTRLGNACRNQPVCGFFETVLSKDESPCNICTEELSNDAFIKSRNNNANIRSESYTKDTFKNTSNVKDKAKVPNRVTLNSHNSTSPSRKLDDQLKDISKYQLNRSEESYSKVESSQVRNVPEGSLPQNRKVSQTGGDFSEKISELKQKEEISHSVDRCDCSKTSHEVEQIPLKQNSSSEAIQFYQDVADSAALIQKESVLVKMNVRIKTLETNLSLINRYLQHLSESYRMQVEDMLSMFDRTIKAITITSAKSANVDKQQQLVIDQLDRKSKILSLKMQHLSNGQRGILKQVLELHGFFLILEIIIMSTIFSVFFNKFKRDVIA